MSQEYYWHLSIFVGSLALCISMYSVWLSRRTAERNTRNLLVSKKSEVLVTVNQLHDSISELMLVTLEQIIIFQESEEFRSEMFKAHIRLRNNLALMREKQTYLNQARQELANQAPTDFESWEDMKATFTSWSNNVRSNIAIETKALESLKEKLEATRARS
jgi:hypothetical protein